MGPTAAVAAFAGTHSIPATAFDHAKLILLDCLGVALAATTRPIGKIARAYAREPGGKAEATLMGGGTKLPIAQAAFANGVCANAYVFEEGSHLPTHVFPAALALAERDGRSGRDLLEAFIVGYEVGARLTAAFDSKREERRGPSIRGWWHAGLVGPFSVAVAVARLLRLSPEVTAKALGLASCSAGGQRRNAGTMAEPLHSGNAARDGIQAALLASRGFTGDPEILEAPLGFLAALTEPEDRDETALTERLGKPFLLEQFPRFKPFPTCTPIQVEVQAVLDLLRERPLSPDDIEIVEADLHPTQLLRPEAVEDNNAGFCGPFVLAATIVRGRMGFEETGIEAIRDARIQGLAKRIVHKPDRDKPTVRIRLRSGETLTAPIQPLRRQKSLADLMPKFRDCAGRVLDGAEMESLIDVVTGLDKEQDLGRLVRLIGKPVG
jgi:2-methylcitrate dehydratase PrpD